MHHHEYLSAMIPLNKHPTLIWILIFNYLFLLLLFYVSWQQRLWLWGENILQDHKRQCYHQKVYCANASTCHNVDMRPGKVLKKPSLILIELFKTQLNTFVF